jgi:AAA domain
VAEITRSAPSPIPIDLGELSRAGDGQALLPPSPIPIASAPALSAEAADAGKAGEGRGEGRLYASGSAPSAITDSPDAQQAADDARFPFFTASQLNSGQFETRYLIPGVLTAAQPGGIFGAFKTLKTSLTADLLISLASGTPFLGHFPVAEPGRTLFLSGESGLAALQSIARRIAAARGLSLETLDNFELSPKLPNLDSPDDVRALGRIVRRKKPVCVAIDPAYLAIRGEDARNLFAMGSLLRPLAELCDETGSAILIVHHCKRSRIIPGNPATLDDIAWSGFAEFSAQWFLLSRRRRFDPDLGRHELWFSTGGRAGHHGLWALDVDEARPSPTDDGSPTTGEGRVWETNIRRIASAATQSEARQIEASEDRRVRRATMVFERDRDRTVKALVEVGQPASARYLRDMLGINGNRMRQILLSLLTDGAIVRSDYRNGLRMEVGYTLSEAFKTWMNPDTPSAGLPTPPPDQDLSGGSVGRDTLFQSFAPFPIPAS